MSERRILDSNTNPADTLFSQITLRSALFQRRKSSHSENSSFEAAFWYERRTFYVLRWLSGRVGFRDQQRVSRERFFEQGVWYWRLPRLLAARVVVLPQYFRALKLRRRTSDECNCIRSYPQFLLPSLAQFPRLTPKYLQAYGDFFKFLLGGIGLGYSFSK